MPLPAQCCRSVQAIVKMVCTSELSFRGAKRRGNLAEPGWITWYSRRKRNCLPEIATSACGLLAMTNRGGHPRFIDGPLITPVQRREGTARPLQGACGRRGRSVILGCAWRSLSAATDAIGACRFIDSLFVSTASPTTIIGNFPIFCSLDPCPLVYFSESFPN